MTDYYDIPALSNSDLGFLRKQLYGIEEIENLDYIFAFGSLVDAILTEPKPVIQECISSPFLDDSDIEHAKNLARYCRKDPLVSLMLPHASGQEVIIRYFTFNVQGHNFQMRCKCKFDMLSLKRSTGADFKTLSVRSYKEFLNSIDHFDYDRQAAYYMDLAEIQRFWIIGISKKTGEVFKLAIQRGDNTYISGREKYEYWALKYFTMIHGVWDEEEN